MDIHCGALGLGRIRVYNVTKNTDTHTHTHAQTWITQLGNPLYFGHIHYMTLNMHVECLHVQKSQIKWMNVINMMQILHDKLFLVYEIQINDLFFSDALKWNLSAPHVHLL